MPRAYYNEIDKANVAWLKELIAENLIAPGDVDDRDIRDVKPIDLAGYTQCHFFAGIGGWSLALRRAGVADHAPLWTGSCPCQPFSAAGRRRGFADERHLWPSFYHLITQCRPAKLYGEQVASAADWLRLVRGDLEALEYAVGAMPIEAASAGADHLRDRFWFVADANSQGEQRQAVDGEVAGQCSSVSLAHSSSSRPSIGASNGRVQPKTLGAFSRQNSPDARAAFNLADRNIPRSYPHSKEGASRGTVSERGRTDGALPDRSREQVGSAGQPRECERVEWVIGADGKARRVGTDFRRLVDGLPEFLGRMRIGCFSQSKEAVMTYGAKNSLRPAEVLRALRQTVLSDQDADQEVAKSPGVCEAEVLLPYLCELERQCEAGGSPSAITEVEAKVLRSLRLNCEIARASHRRQRIQQCADEHADPLHPLSRLLAQHARTAWEAHRQTNAKAMALLAHGIPHRVGLLRGFGNAIDPRPAAAFIVATM